MFGLSDFVWAVTLLIVLDTILFFIGRLITSSDIAHSSKGIPLYISIGTCFIALVVHLFGVGVATGIAGVFGNPGGSLALLGTSVITGAAPGITFGYMIMQSSAAFGVGLVMGDEKDGEEKTDNNKALLLLKEGKVEEAVAEYELQAAMFPDDAAPRCGLAGLLEHQDRLEEAAAAWRDVRDRYPKDTMAQKKAKARLTDIGRRMAQIEDDLLPDPLAQDQPFDYDAAENKTSPASALPPKTDAQTAPRDMETAHRLARQAADADGTVSIYRQYYHVMNPPTAQPLFAAVTALEGAQRFEEAKTILQEIGHDFHDDQRTWAKAMLNLAGLFDNSLGDPSAAEYILNQIQREMPGTEQCRMAGDHLTERRK